MLTNYHTHSTYCDGKHSPKEMILSAIDKGFVALGFSGHGAMDFDIYSMKDTDAYIKEISNLKKEFADKIQIYLGIEEEMFCPINRSKFDYMIGSSHHLYTGGNKYAIDHNPNSLKNCVDFYKGDVIKMSEDYYSNFYNYIINRKPDIIGHIDLITKFDENNDFNLLKNPEYNKVAEFYTEKIAKTGLIIEVNTGAISRGWRKTPYPAENLLKIIKKHEGKIILSSDCHDKNFLDCHYNETKSMLKYIGFKTSWHLIDNKFIEVDM